MKITVLISLAVLAIFACKKKDSSSSTSDASNILISRFGDAYYTYDINGKIVTSTLIEGGKSYAISWSYNTDSVLINSPKGNWSQAINSNKFNALGTYDVSGVLTHINEGGWEIFNTVVDGDVVKAKEIESKQLYSYKKVIYTNVLNKEKLPLLDFGGLGLEWNPYLYGNTVKHLPERVYYMDSTYTNTINTISYVYERNSDGLVSKIKKIWSGQFSDSTVISVEYKK